MKNAEVFGAIEVTPPKRKIVVAIDMGHSRVDPINGKVSPDKSFYEWKSNRVLGWKIIDKLTELGVTALPVVTKDEDNKKIGVSARAARVNNICKKYGTSNVIMVSIHSNAAGTGGWMDARGWSVFVAGNASKGSKQLADSIYDEVEKAGFKMRKPLPKQKYWVQNFTVIYKTNCKCCLTESLFYDNKEDLKLLKDPATIEKLAECHVRGILNWIDSQ